MRPFVEQSFDSFVLKEILVNTYQKPPVFNFTQAIMTFGNSDTSDADGQSGRAFGLQELDYMFVMFHRIIYENCRQYALLRKSQQDHFHNAERPYIVCPLGLS